MFVNPLNVTDAKILPQIFSYGFERLRVLRLAFSVGANQKGAAIASRAKHRCISFAYAKRVDEVNNFATRVVLPELMTL
jgi:hypothetical protein